LLKTHVPSNVTLKSHYNELQQTEIFVQVDRIQSLWQNHTKLRHHIFNIKRYNINTVLVSKAAV